MSVYPSTKTWRFVQVLDTRFVDCFNAERQHTNETYTMHTVLQDSFILYLPSFQNALLTCIRNFFKKVRGNILS